MYVVHGAERGLGSAKVDGLLGGTFQKVKHEEQFNVHEAKAMQKIWLSPAKWRVLEACV